MANPTGGILTPSQREFLLGKNLENKSKSSKSMTRNRIVKRIQISYTKDIPLIANSLAADGGYNSLTPERIVDVEDRENLLDGLALQVALVRELAEAAGANPEKIIQQGRSLELLTIEEQIQKKAEQNPQELTIREAAILDEMPQELEDKLWDSMIEVMKELDEADDIDGSSRVDDAFDVKNDHS